MPQYKPLVLNNRQLSLPKAAVSPDLAARTVLTNEPWDFVDLELVRQGKTDARFYWQQAREFYGVATGLRLQSAPLLLYYAFMNATKALLSSKGIAFNPHHGVGEWSPSPASTLDDLTVGIKFKQINQNAILPALSAYYNETETVTQHTLSDLFFNLPFIHRTYCLTNDPMEEMFISIVNPHLVFEDGTTNVFLMAKFTSSFPGPRYCSNLPPAITALAGGCMVSTNSVAISSVANPSAADIGIVCGLIKQLREDVFYINGVDTLWYVKAVPTSGVRLNRQTTTLTLAAMHRLSEESRYQPKSLVKCLEGNNNWLVSEFIKMSGFQFIDEIASEITGKQFLRPNVRQAN